ncbi:hypothetical protein Q31b_28120 [Novipirellula aureliae]|uniref:Uncharacterized protein n=1 Tax=Novipirellula aureliae TaxID=2527966 RepID=A0A5C6DXI3_9BACT|nr:hypothetical protein [Novipirellula aureliae]TWU41368.1 hypothetical protein Q31b_28120 [Novipirellula aureliae]
MPKYYVQCGPIETVLDSDSPSTAAVNALDAALQNHLWIYDDCGLSERDCKTHLMLEALLHFDPSIQVSEQGFDRADAIQIGTPETVEAWHCLMVSLKRLFVAAGLTTRTMSSIGATATIECHSPRLPR